MDRRSGGLRPRARALSAARFQIRTGRPARRSERTIPAPIVPVPRTATTGFVMPRSFPGPSRATRSARTPAGNLSALAPLAQW